MFKSRKGKKVGVKRSRTLAKFVCTYCKDTKPASGSVSYTCYCSRCGSIMLSRR